MRVSAVTPVPVGRCLLVRTEICAGRLAGAGVPPIRDGIAALPDLPGLGVAFAPDAAGSRPAIRRPLAMRPRRDRLVVAR